MGMGEQVKKINRREAILISVWNLINKKVYKTNGK